VEDFLNSLDDKHHYFAAPMSLYARLNKVGLADVIDQFRVHLAKMTSFNENIKGKSMATFQGRQDKDKDSNPNVSDRHERPERIQCPCGSKHFRHSPKHCYFLMPEKRPKDWMPNSILLERFNDSLKKAHNDSKWKASLENLLKHDLPTSYQEKSMVKDKDTKIEGKMSIALTRISNTNLVMSITLEFNKEWKDWLIFDSGSTCLP
jgi:hypothetical protein